MKVESKEFFFYNQKSKLNENRFYLQKKMSTKVKLKAQKKKKKKKSQKTSWEEVRQFSEGKFSWGEVDFRWSQFSGDNFPFA